MVFMILDKYSCISFGKTVHELYKTNPAGTQPLYTNGFFLLV